MDTTIKFHIEDLTDNGRLLLAAVTSQSRHLATLLRPRDGIIHADIAGGSDSDDVVRVRVRDRLTWAERARRYGVAALEWGDVARDADGQPIRSEDGQEYVPTEVYIAARERALGDVRTDSRIWEVPRDIIRRVGRDELYAADAWNAIADAFTSWCAAGAFEVVISPDWVTMTAAAEEFGVTNAAVRNAAARGSVATWEDWREPNSQKRSRVWRPDAARLWAASARTN